MSKNKQIIPQAQAKEESSRLFRAVDWTTPQAESRTTVIDLTFLRPLSEILRDAETVEQLWERVCRLLQAQFSFHEATLALEGETRHVAEVRASFGGSESRDRRATLPWNKFSASLDALPDQIDPASEISSFFFTKKFASALIVPLRLRPNSARNNSPDLIWEGALAFSHEHPQAFHAWQRELVQALADLLAGSFVQLRGTWQQRAAEAELQRREKELENLVFVISHSLKTPIVSIQGFANLLHEELQSRLGEEYVHFLERIQKNAALMEKMILDLLEFYRLGHETTKLDWCDLQEIVSHVVNDMKLLEQTSLSPSEFTAPAAGTKMAEAEFAMPAHLPRLLAEANGLKAVFENLLSNAMKYRRPEAPLRVEVGWQEQPRFHAFWVRDNGMGMEPAFQQKAFNLFQRAPNGGKIAGTGVGLALVRRIIENHKGMIKLDSKPGEGTSVYFTIPKLEQLKS
ncbi:MAG: sensor histidine kinase [bacterium]